jgi:hypothetical protein
LLFIEKFNYFMSPQNAGDAKVIPSFAINRLG